MKTYKLMVICVAGILLASCDKELKEEAKLNVNVQTNENVSFDGKTITVKKGTPIIFDLAGDPDFITFFSGEVGSKYEYKDRIVVDEKEIEASNLNFSLWPQYGNAACTEGVLSMYISESFPGLDKNHFENDSILVEKFDWKELIPQNELPQKPLTATTAMEYNVDLKPYLGKRLTIAIRYQGKLNTASQPRMNFVNMKIDNAMTNGQITNLYAGAFGFTPVNMDNKKNFADQVTMTKNREYGTVTNNTNGIWNLVNAGTGSLFIHSSGAGGDLKYSWLVSDMIVINSCSPDHGVNIKNTTQSLTSYTYQYEEKGTYTATFVARNANFKYDSSSLQQLTINVIE